MRCRKHEHACHLLFFYVYVFLSVAVSTTSVVVFFFWSTPPPFLLLTPVWLLKGKKKGTLLGFGLGVCTLSAAVTVVMIVV
ncbi:hypothetical protein B0F90DRAFT_195811 [Multifurca ochricompacta]|uniref:Uncharacterized protein n=1 Tax=Multifurca ochricompacta TaxID=376703 RepID=A0AAD4QJU5_9AGAM|nr:hypothetical protein B0F90DRAFT_195811 [Multifurca ochricompacta]